jgi:cation diffusion facilitator family transporter
MPEKKNNNNNNNSSHTSNGFYSINPELTESTPLMIEKSSTSSFASLASTISSKADQHPKATAIKFTIFLAMWYSYVIVLVIFGISSNSLALLTEGMHTTGDALIYSVNVGLYYISKRGVTDYYPFGYGRYSVLGGLLSGIIIVLGAIIMCTEAISAIIKGPEEAEHGQVIWVAAVGLCVNVIALFLIPSSMELEFHDHSGDEEEQKQPHKKKKQHNRDLNLHGIFRNLIADSVSTILILLTAIFGYFADFKWTKFLDPAITIIIAFIIIFIIAKPLLQQAVYILLQSTPAHIEVETLQRSIEQQLNGVEVEQMRLWTLSGSQVVGTLNVNLLAKHFCSQSVKATINSTTHQIKDLMNTLGVSDTTVEIKII